MIISHLVAALNIAVLILGLGLVVGALAVVVRHPVLILVGLGRQFLLFVRGRGGLIGSRRRGSSLVRLGGDIDRRAVRPGSGRDKPEKEKILKI